MKKPLEPMRDLNLSLPSPNPLHRTCFSASLACWLLWGSAAHGAIGILTEYGTLADGSDFDGTISTTDLVNSGSPSLSSISSTPLAGAPLGNVHDGTSLSGYIRESVGAIPNEYPATIDFNLDVVANPLGYQLTSLSTFTGAGLVFDPGGFSGREHELAHQSYTVSYSLVGDAGFTAFSTVTAVADPGDGELAIKVTLVNIASVVPAGVDVVRFQWFDPVPSIAPSTDPGESATVIREIDIFGSAVQVPEPGSTLLLLPAFTLLVSRRRRH